MANGQRAIVWGIVYYQYEHYAYSDWGGYTYYVYDLLYPVEIDGLQSLQVIGSYVQPSSPPTYARGPLKGDAEIWFAPTRTTDNKLPISTSIGMSIGAFGFSISITVSPYEAGDNNIYYTTPSIVVKDASGGSYDWYYWWYLNNDPMTYVVQFFGKS